ncbi:MAG TPA: hypothetical protein VFY64_07210 [Nitrososphaeraceae archaeon]|nr:hypothetical protein [Nitrososphaeraceae archaeon]
MKPVHIDAKDRYLVPNFRVEVSDCAIPRWMIDRLQSCRRVEAAYFKPSDELAQVIIHWVRCFEGLQENGRSTRSSSELANFLTSGRELIVVAKPAVGLRVRTTAIESLAGADVGFLQDILSTV